MSANRIVACPICGKEIEVRSNFAHQTLTNHIKTSHPEKVVS
jgi:hypothetical protein